jgi:hypothetical protein
MSISWSAQTVCARQRIERAKEGNQLRIPLPGTASASPSTTGSRWRTRWPGAVRRWTGGSPTVTRYTTCLDLDRRSHGG